MPPQPWQKGSIKKREGKMLALCQKISFSNDAPVTSPLSEIQVTVRDRFPCPYLLQFFLHWL